MCCQVTRYVIQFCALSFRTCMCTLTCLLTLLELEHKLVPGMVEHGYCTWSMRNSKLHTSRSVLVITPGMSLLSKLKQSHTTTAAVTLMMIWLGYCLSLAITFQSFSADGWRPATSLARARSWHSSGQRNCGAMVCQCVCTVRVSDSVLFSCARYY